MPWDKVMHKFKGGNLHSGSKTGPPVKDRKQAIAVLLAEKRKAESGDSEYSAGPSSVAKARMAKKARGR